LIGLHTHFYYNITNIQHNGTSNLQLSKKEEFHHNTLSLLIKPNEAKVPRIQKQIRLLLAETVFKLQTDQHNLCSSSKSAIMRVKTQTATGD
jgi:hypothetical protein